jgi:hypothetical protein
MTRYRSTSSVKITVNPKPKPKPPLTWWEQLLRYLFGRR